MKKQIKILERVVECGVRISNRGRNKNHYVYMLKCSDSTLYTGCTNNLEKRISEHDLGKRGAKYTRTRRPIKLVFSEAHKNLAAGRKREAQIKRMTRAQKLVLIQNC